jgi:hypothetical protein
VSLPKPYWKTRSGTTVDTSSMSKVAVQKVAELEPYVSETANRLLLMQRDLEKTQEELTESRGQLEYWKTMKALAAEIDERLAGGEEVTDVNTTEVGGSLE